MNNKEQTTENTNNPEKKQYEIEAGAVWVRQGAKGSYLSVKVEIEGIEYHLVGFKNRFKVSPADNKPSYRLYFRKQEEAAEKPRRVENKSEETEIILPERDLQIGGKEGGERKEGDLF